MDLQEGTILLAEFSISPTPIEDILLYEHEVIPEEPNHKIS